MNNLEIRNKLVKKLDHLSSKQLISVWQLVESLENENSLTNEAIDAILKNYCKDNKKRPIGLSKGEFIMPNDFNEPLPDEILETFYY